MQPLDVNTDAAFSGFLPGVSNPTGEDDPALIVRFFMKPMLMGAKSEAAKRPIYEDREHVEIIIKGQPLGISHEVAKDEHRAKFPRAYARFRAGKAEVAIGTPIEMLPGVGPSMALNLKAIHLRTVEDLAGVTDESTFSRIGMGARELVNRAKAWVAQQAPAQVDLSERLAKSDAENAELRRMLEETNRLMASLKKEPAKRRTVKRAKKHNAEPEAAPA